MNEGLIFGLVVFVVSLITLGVVLRVATAETKAERIAHESREADRQISRIGREARAAILEEMLRHEQAQRSRWDVVEGKVVEVRESPPPWDRRPPSS